MSVAIISKYNVPGPRYTSYPTVPYWDRSSFSLRDWKVSVKNQFSRSENEGISLYVHLPFCESLCTFCGCHKRITKRHDVEKPYIKAVLKEWSLYCDLLGTRPKIKALHLGGGTPTFFTPENLALLVNGLFYRGERAGNISCSFEGHPNNTTKEHLEALYNLGFKRVSFGVQDYNPTVQCAINRKQSFEKVNEVTKVARQIGFESVGHDIIFGLPFQTLEHVMETINKTSEIKPDTLAFYSYAHVPWMKGNGQRGFKDQDLPTAETKRMQYELGKQLLQEVGYTEIGMDHFALKSDVLYKSSQQGELHRNFMGYVPVKTKMLIGLGVSAISDSGQGFAQNEKGIESYYHLLDEGIIPAYRGHMLNNEDQIIRYHIQNLMCGFKTSWEDEAYYFDGVQDVLERLNEMENDGLIVKGDNGVSVTDKGRPFVRNVCMAFDLRLHKNKPETRLFSMTI